MDFCVSTCKSSPLNSKDRQSTISYDLILNTSTFGFKQEDDCKMYLDFLKEIDKLHKKVKNGDLSEFEEF